MASNITLLREPLAKRLLKCQSVCILFVVVVIPLAKRLLKCQSVCILFVVVVIPLAKRLLKCQSVHSVCCSCYSTGQTVAEMSECAFCLL